MTRTQSEDNMSSGWKTVKLGEIADFANGKKRPIKKGGIPVYGGNGILDYTNQSNMNGGIIIGRVGAYCGNVYIEKRPCWVSDNAIKATCKDNADTYFVYYCMKTLKLNERRIGTSQPLLTQNILNNIAVSLPPLDVQRRIAAVLKPLDDKIELNARINARLERAAQALFKRHFVRFEPYGGTMPPGWRVGTLSEIVDTMIAGDWGKDAPTEKNTERVYCIRGADIPEVKAGNKGKMPMRYIQHKNLEAKQLVDGDIVVEISGGSPTQSTGRVAAISQSLLDRYNGAMVCTNFCKAIKPQKGYSAFVYYYWQYLYDKGIFFTYENGTTGIKNLDISGFIEREPIVIPTYEDALKFADFCKAIFDMIFANGLQSETLARLRDVLLPRLMSGAVDVRQVYLNSIQKGGSR